MILFQIFEATELRFKILRQIENPLRYALQVLVHVLTLYYQPVHNLTSYY